MERLNNNQLTWLEIARREGWQRIERIDEVIYLYCENNSIKFNLYDNIVDLINLDNRKVYEIEDLCIYNKIEYIGYFVEIRDYKNKVVFISHYCDSMLNLFRDVINGIDKFKKTLYIKKVIIYIDNDNKRKMGFKIIKKFDTVKDFKNYIKLSD